MKLKSVMLASAVGALALSAPAAADTKFPNERAACVAQAWVPNNTDPAVAPSELGTFVSSFAQTGEWGYVIAQHGCKI